VTKDQQIQQALKLLAPPAAEREVCVHEIRRALGRVENFTAVAHASRVSRSKKGGVVPYNRALRQLLKAIKSLDPAIKPWFRLALSDSTVSSIKAEIATTEEFLKQLPASPRRDGSRNKAAVRAAYDLLAWRGHNATLSRGGPWEELAQILADDLSVDLFEHMRKFKQSRPQIVEKVRVDSKAILYRSATPQPGIKSSRKKSDN
jgi:hypothetical protein